jgi:hypothetical protein
MKTPLKKGIEYLLKREFSSFRPWVFFSLGFLICLMIEPALAQADNLGASYSAGTGSNDALQDLAKILSHIIQVLTFLALFILQVGGELFGTNYIIGEEIMETIRPMWSFVRNITNLGFVLILLFLAFSNMFSFGEGGSWTIKEKLPKIILSLVAINFSLLGMRVLIQATDAGTVAILSIADTALEERSVLTLKDILSQPVDRESGEVCEKDGGGDCVPFNEFLESTQNQQDKLFSIKLDDLSDEQTTTRNIMTAFGVYFMHLERLPQLSAKLGSESSTGGILAVVDSVLFSTIMALAYIVVLIAVFIALLARMMAMWFFLIFSPLLMAGWIMGFGGGKGGEMGQKFITYLILPLKIAAVFALSFVMIAAAKNIPAMDVAQWLVPGDSIAKFLGKDNNIFDLLWQFMTVAIFWVAAFKAIDGTEAKTIIDGVKNSSQSLGEFALRAGVTDRSIIPIPGMEDGTSINAIRSLPSLMLGQQQQAGREQNTKLLSQLGIMDETQRKLNESASKLITKLDRMDTLTSNPNSIQQYKQAFAEHNINGAEDIAKLTVDNKRSILAKLGMTGTELESALNMNETQLKNAIMRHLGGGEQGRYYEIFTEKTSSGSGNQTPAGHIFNADNTENQNATVNNNMLNISINEGRGSVKATGEKDTSNKYTKVTVSVSDENNRASLREDNDFKAYIVRKYFGEEANVGDYTISEEDSNLIVEPNPPAESPAQ